MRFAIYPERGSSLSAAPASVLAPQFALSHDGNSLAFVATWEGRDMIWVRRLGAQASRPLPGTDGGIYPFWSPDNRSIGFFSQGRLKIVTTDGGPAVTITDASFDSRGGAWAPDGTLLVNLVSNGGLWRVLTNGSAELIAPLDEASGETSLRWPSFLPDSRHFLTVVRSLSEPKRGVYLQDMATRGRSRLVTSDWGAAVVDGHLLFVRGRTLMAQPLDIALRRLTGEPTPLLDGVGSTTNGYSAFATSANGTIAYSEPWPTLGQLIWFDRGGQQLGQPVASLADYVDFSLSPGGRRLAVSRVEPQTNTSDIWVLDLASGVEARLTADPMNDAGPMWSPDESGIYFRSNRQGVNSLFMKPANGSRAEELVFEQRGEASSSLMPSSLSTDGTRMLYTDSGLRSSFDVWSLSLEGTPKANAELRGPFNEFQGTLSPDGRWMAFVTDETGATQVYVQSFPGGEQRQQVSSRGGTEPQFRSDGRELFFLDGNRMLMAAPVSQGPSLAVGLPVPLFRTRVPTTGNPYRRPYIVAADGQRFLVNTTPADAPVPAIQLILLACADRREARLTRGRSFREALRHGALRRCRLLERWTVVAGCGDRVGIPSEQVRARCRQHALPPDAFELAHHGCLHWEPDHVGGERLEDRLPTGSRRSHREVLVDQGLAVDRLPPAIHGHLEGWAKVPDGVLAPIEPGEHAAAPSPLFDELPRGRIADRWLGR